MKNLYKIENEELKKEVEQLQNRINESKIQNEKMYFNFTNKIRDLKTKYDYEVKMIEETYEQKIILKTNKEKVIESIENRIITWCNATWNKMDIEEVELIKAYGELIREVNK